MGKVSFSGIVKEVCLAYTPEAERAVRGRPCRLCHQPGGRAGSDGGLRMLEQMDELAELDIPQPA